MVREGITALIAAFAVISRLKVDFYSNLYDVEILDEYDFIVVGAGASGSVVAGRLSENRNSTVLLLEAGVSGNGDMETEVPFFATRQLWSSKDWKYLTESFTHASGQKQPYYQGKMGGGTASMNYMVYNRGSKADYDSWAELGLEGWSFADVEPFFKKVENRSDDRLSQYLGRNGMIKLTQSYHHKEYFDVLKDAYTEIGFEHIDYLIDGGLTEGISRVTSNIYNGIRQSSIVNYVFPFYKQRKERFHLSFKSMVHRILIKKENGKTIAYGIVFEKNGVVKEVRSRKEVIVSAGAFNSPKILLQSGIGTKDHLSEIGIDVAADLPGVGLNLQDHAGLILSLYSDKTTNLTVSYDEVLRTFPDYLSNSKETPFLSAVQSPAYAHLRTEEPGRIGLSEIPTITMMFSALQSNPALIKKYKREMKKSKPRRKEEIDLFNFSIVLLRPKSSGTVRLRSSNPNDPPLIDFNFLSDPYDLEILINGMKILQQMEVSEAFKKVNLKLIEYQECKESSSNISRSDEYSKCLIKRRLIGAYHAGCTNKMGPENDPMAVLDSRLRVYGVKGLRVADASVFPNMVSGNTQAPCFMIGEKVSHMITEDWNLL